MRNMKLGGLYFNNDGSVAGSRESSFSSYSSSVKYSRFRSDDGFSDIQYNAPPTRIPWRAIGLAVTLFLMGSLLIVIGSLLLAGVIDTKYSDRTWPVLILGSILFIPGAYHVRIAYYAFKGFDGFSFDDIPDFD